MLSCNVVEDLMPSFLELLTSNETNDEINAHLEQCEHCRQTMDILSSELSLEKAPKPQMNFLKKLRRKQIIGAVISAAAALLCMYWLYSMEFSVDVTNTVTLEAAIDEYFFTEDVDADILESQSVGKNLVVFFDRTGYNGHFGTAILERGIFGKYRFISAGLRNSKLYCYSFVDSSRLGKTCMLLYGINSLPEVASYAVYPSDDTSQQPIYQGNAEAAPFMKIIQTKAPENYVGNQFVHYYDAEGNELDPSALRQTVPDPAEGRCPGVGSAELNLIYFYLAVLLVVGIVFVRYFLKP